MQPLPINNDGDDDKNIDDVDDKEEEEEDDDANLQQLVGFAQFTPILLLSSLQAKLDDG